MGDRRGDGSDGGSGDGADGAQQHRVGTVPFGGNMEPRDMAPEGNRDGSAEASGGGETDPPRYVRWIGQVGVYTGVIAVTLAAGGIMLSWQGIQPYGNIGITLGLVLAVLAMILGTVFQVYLSDFDVPVAS